MGDIDHRAVREAEDRSSTRLLLERLVRPEEPLTEIAATLTCIADPRMVAPLMSILEDGSRPAALRDAAGEILRGSGLLAQDGARGQWLGGDDVLRRHALLTMGREAADIIEPVARDVGHPLHREAIVAMEWGFQEPRFQALKIAALTHADPAVREAAADVLVWDEPVAAETALLRAAEDAVEAVAIAALRALEYYPSRACIERLEGLREARAARGEVARSSLSAIRGNFLQVLMAAEGGARAALTAWMRPSQHVLAFSNDELCPATDDTTCAPLAPPRAEPVDAGELLDSLGDPDGPWAFKKELLRRADAARFSLEERTRLTPFLTTHGDPAVREQASRLLAAWDDHNALIRLVSDPVFVVMKAATYYLGQTTPSATAARWARDHLSDPRAVSTHGYETLTTYAHHASPAEGIPFLAQVAREDARESLRHHAVTELARLGARAEIASLLPLLDDPPAVTWAVHLVLLSACEKLGLTPRIGETLRAADNLDVQAAIAPWVGQPRPE
jgi:HEAT repeat protein